LKLCTSRWLAFEKVNEDGQFSGVHERIIFSIPVSREQAQTNPRLTRWRTKDPADSVGERLRETARYRAIRINDQFHGNDWHAA